MQSQQRHFRLGNYPLTNKEAISFLSDDLEMPDFQVKMQQHKLNTLNNILGRFKRIVPGGNVSVLTENNDNYVQDERQFLVKVKNHILSHRGGHCFWFSSFLSALLAHIGYKVGLVGANDRSLDSIYNVHAAIIVFDLLYPGSKHLLEASPTYPIFEAVRLPLKGEEDVYLSRYGGRKHKFVNAGGDIIKYCHLLEKGERPRTDWSDVISEHDGLWEVDMEYRTASCIPLSYFTENAFLVTAFPTIISFNHRNLFLRGFSQGKWVLIFNQRVTLRDEKGFLLEKLRASSSSDVVNFVTTYFPQFSPEEIEKGWDKKQAFDLSCRW